MKNLELMGPESYVLDVPSMLFNLGFCIIASFMLRQLYIHRSISLSGRFHIGSVIPILSCVTFLVIMVVKSSLALSLGLVGALSVVRFRTPIKEPEELVYLFLAIALGLGYGAGQTVITSIVFVVLLGLIFLWLSRKAQNTETEYNLFVDWTGSDLGLSEILEVVQKHVSMVEFLKLTTGANERSAFLKVDLNNVANLDAVAGSLTIMDPKITCSFYEARPLQ